MITFVPQVVYNSITVNFSISQGLWDPASEGEGGFDISAAGVPESFEYRRDETCKLRLRFFESEWAGVRDWLIWAQQNAGSSFTFIFQASPLVGSYTVYLDKPKMGDKIEPKRTDTKGVSEIEVVIRTTTGSPINVQAY